MYKDHYTYTHAKIFLKKNKKISNLFSAMVVFKKYRSLCDICFFIILNTKRMFNRITEKEERAMYNL